MKQIYCVSNLKLNNSIILNLKLSLIFFMVNVSYIKAQQTVVFEKGALGIENKRCLTVLNKSCLAVNKTNYFEIKNVNRLSYKIEYNIKEDSITAYRDYIGELITKVGLNMPKFESENNNTFISEIKNQLQKNRIDTINKIVADYTKSLFIVKENYKKILVSENWDSMKVHKVLIYKENNKLEAIRSSILNYYENLYAEDTTNTYNIDFALNSIQIIDTLQDFIQNINLLDANIFYIKVPFKTKGVSTTFKVNITPIQHKSLGILNSMLLPKQNSITIKHRWAGRAMLNFSLGKIIDEVNSDELLYNRIDNVLPFKSKTGDSITFVADKKNVISSSILLTTNLNLLTRVNNFTEIGAQIGFGATLLDNKPKIGLTLGGSIVLWDKLQLSIGQFYSKYQTVSNTSLIGKSTSAEIEFKENNYNSNWKANTFISIGYSIPIFNK